MDIRNRKKEYTNFNKNLKQAREKRGFSIAEFAESLGIPKNTYIAYENQNREPSYYLLCKIAERLNVTIDELLSYEKNPLGWVESELKPVLENTNYSIIRYNSEEIVIGCNCVVYADDDGEHYALEPFKRFKLEELKKIFFDIKSAVEAGNKKTLSKMLTLEFLRYLFAAKKY